MTRPTISGVAIDTLLLSRIGVPLFHHYRIISRSGTHAAFRETYRLHAFLEESDAASVRRHHRRCAKELVARLSQSSGRDSAEGTAAVSTRPTVYRPETSQAGGGGGEAVLLGLREIGSPASVGSVHCTSSDGIGASSLCGVGRWASSSTQAVEGIG